MIVPSPFENLGLLGAAGAPSTAVKKILDTFPPDIPGTCSHYLLENSGILNQKLYLRGPELPGAPHGDSPGTFLQVL